MGEKGRGGGGGDGKRSKLGLLADQYLDRDISMNAVPLPLVMLSFEALKQIMKAWVWGDGGGGGSRQRGVKREGETETERGE